MSITVASGVTSSGLTISSGDPLVVLNGGEVEASTILSGGSATLSSGSTGSGLTVRSGGVLQGSGDVEGQLWDYGSVSGVTVTSSGLLLIYPGATASGVTLTGSGGISVFEGATAVGTVVSGGAVLEVGGLVSGTVVENGGTEAVLPGAFPDSVASGDTIMSGGVLSAMGGNLSDETILSGATYDAFVSFTNSTVTLGRAASATVLGGATISSGGVLDANFGYVGSGGVLNLAGTTAYNLLVISGGVVKGPGELTGYQAHVADGGSIVGVTAGDVLLMSGGTATGVTAVGSLTILSGASATGTMVISGGEELVSSGGAASGTTVSSGGRAFVLSGGSASAATVLSGGLERVLAGGAASGDVVQSGGVLDLGAGGTVADERVQSGGILGFDANLAGSLAVGAAARRTVLGGVTVSSGGVIDLIAATVLSGGVAHVISGGVASDDTVRSGGGLIVSSGTVASGDVVQGGGKALVSAGGTMAGLGLLSGGILIDDGQVRTAGAGTLAGVYRGSGALVETGGGDLLLSGNGGQFSGNAVIEGGVIELATARALGTGAVAFVEPSTGSAVLQIDAADAPRAGGSFANTISNFSGANEDIDLRSIAYVAGASATLTGSTLVLTDGGKTYSFHVAGTTAGAYPVLSDGHGGTLIDPEVARFAQTAAAFAPSDAAKTALISSTSPIAQIPFAHATAARL